MSATAVREADVAMADDMSSNEWTARSFLWIVVTALAAWKLGAWCGIPAALAGYSLARYGRARARETEAMKAVVFERTFCPNGTVVTTMCDPQADLYVTNAVRNRVVLGSWKSHEQQGATRTHKEVEARYG